MQVPQHARTCKPDLRGGTGYLVSRQPASTEHKVIQLLSAPLLLPRSFSHPPLPAQSISGWARGAVSRFGLGWQKKRGGRGRPRNWAGRRRVSKLPSVLPSGSVSLPEQWKERIFLNRSPCDESRRSAVGIVPSSADYFPLRSAIVHGVMAYAAEFFLPSCPFAFVFFSDRNILCQLH